MLPTVARVGRLCCGVILCLVLAGCDRLDMYDQPRYEPLEASPFFADGLSARPPVEGTIARGLLREDEAFHTGKEKGALVHKFPEAAYHAIYERRMPQFETAYEETPPVELRRALLERGRERFEIYCIVCHGQTGAGDGMIVQRGLRKPPSYQIDRLRRAPAGHFFDVMTRGYGAMASYASRVDAEDRWAIVAYIRALQLSQHAELQDVPDDERAALGSADAPDNQRPGEERRGDKPAGGRVP